MNFIIDSLFKKTLVLASITMIITSCGGSTHYLSSGSFSKADTYNINSYYGCCGCKAKYFLINSGKRKAAQVIYSYNCHGIGKPTKFVFNYNKQGRLISCDKYVATTTNDFSMELSDYEKKIFSMLDTSSIMKSTYSVIKFSEIKGFRKPFYNEITHSIPLVKKGHKLQVR